MDSQIHPVMRTCGLCGGVVSGKVRFGRVFCSKSCAMKAWRQRNRDRNNQLKRESAKRNPRRGYFKKWRSENADKVSGYQKKWAQANKANVMARVRKRQAAKLNATPKWLTDDDNRMILLYYEMSLVASKMTGQKHHVDHIVPLQGRNVRGLHVPWNLRLLPSFLNHSKSNRHD